MATKKKAKTTTIGRDSRSGEFVPLKETKKRPATTTVEKVRKKTKKKARKK
jgi:hypothetical protein